MLRAIEENWEPRSWAEAIEGIESPGFLPDEASPEAHEAERRSEHTQLRRRFLELARNLAEDEGITNPYAPRGQDLIGKALDVARRILFAFPSLGSDNDTKASMNAAEIRLKLRLTYPAESGFEMIEMIRNGHKFNLDLGQFEAGVKAYLESEFRDPAIDRTILTVLIDAKTTGFVQAATERPKIAGKHVLFNYSLEKMANRTYLGLWLEGRFVDAAIAAVFAIPAAFIAHLMGLSAGVVFFLAFGYVLIRGIWLLLLLPRFLKEKATLQENVLGGIRRMRALYSEYHSTDDSFFSSPHPISVPRLRSDVERLAEQPGCIWPQSMWAMLDDIEGRGVRRL